MAKKIQWLVANKKSFLFGSVALALLLVVLGVGVASFGRSKFSPVSNSPRKLKVLGKASLANVLRINEIKNADSRSFPKDFQMSVTNISDKPIYHINMVLVYSKTEQVLGRAVISRLVYGATRLVDPRERAQPEDISLKPGDSYIFKMDNASAQRVIDHIRAASGYREDMFDESEIHINVVNFGDGTGYLGGQYYPHAKGSNGVIATSCDPPCGGWVETEWGYCPNENGCLVYRADGGWEGCMKVITRQEVCLGGNCASDEVTVCTNSYW